MLYSIHYILVLLKATATCATLLKRIYWEGWQNCTPCSNEYSWKRSKSIWGKENYSSIEGMQLNEYPLREAIFVICKWSSTNPFIQTNTVKFYLLIYEYYQYQIFIDLHYIFFCKFWYQFWMPMEAEIKRTFLQKVFFQRM